MKVGIFLSYIGLGSNIMHLAYCHEIAKKYGPVTVITICKNFKEAVNNDPNIKEVIYLDKYYKKLSDIFRLSKELYKFDLDAFFINNDLSLSFPTSSCNLFKSPFSVIHESHFLKIILRP